MSTIDFHCKAQRFNDVLNEQLFELTINELRLSATLYRTLEGSSPEQSRCEAMVRTRMGAAVTRLSRLPLTPEQTERFNKAFRDLASALSVATFSRAPEPFPRFKKPATNQPVAIANPCSGSPSQIRDSHPKPSN